MAKPKNKEELLNAGESNYTRLTNFIEAMPPEKQVADFPPGTLNRNVRDVLMHLHHWHGMMMEWYKVGMAGNKPEMPAPGYTWKTTPALNQWIQNEYSEMPLEEAKNHFSESYQQVRRLIEQHNNEELFEKKRYKWTGSTSLGAYLISATSSHYDWAFKLIKKVTK